MRMKKILSLLIAVVMVLSVFGINVFADSTTTTYYLSANGNDSANGTTQQTPFRTFKKVCQMANGKDITVKIIGTFTGNDKDYDTHTGTITIEGIDSSSTFAIQAGIGYTTGGPVIFKNIKYSQGSSAYFFANGSKIVFDSGYSNVQTGQTIILGSRVSTQTTDSINAEVKDGVFGSVFHIGSIVPSNRNTVLNDANVFVDGGSINSLVIGSNGTWATNKGNTFAKNVVIRQDSGMITKISATTISGAETKIEGALILVFNNGTQSTLDPSLDKISIGSRYYVYSGNGGKVIPHKGSDGNVEVGKFDLLLDEDCYGANILNGAESTLVEESGTITLEPGTTTIEYIKEQKYYVNASSGSDSNNGYTEQTPLKTIGAAVSRANGRDFTVVIMNNYAASTSIADHSGLMIITGYDENAKFGIPASYGISLGGKTKFENIKFENGSNSYYYMKGNELVMGDGVEASGYHQIIAGSLGKEVTEKGNVTINSGEFNRLTLGNIATSVTNSITKDISAVINGGKVTALIIGNDGWSASSHKGVTYNGNVLLQVNGGSITNIYGNATYPATLNGAVQFIFNNGSSSNFGDSFKNYRADCGEYYIYSEEGGRVDFVYDDGGNSVTGEFYLTVPNGMYAIVNNANYIETVYESGEIALDPGTTEITYYDLVNFESAVKVTNGEKEYFYYPAAVIDITVGGTIQLPDNLCTGDKIFAGWYADPDFITPIIDGSVVSAGKIYSRIIDVTKETISVIGSDIKADDKIGLRFTSQISTAFVEELIKLNTANQVISPENSEFNKNTDIGFGTVLLPMSRAENDSFIKDEIYEADETEYKVITVPARKLYEQTSEILKYTAVLTHISDKNLVREYGARSYITYKDASGCEHTFYSKTYSSTPYKRAVDVYENYTNVSDEEKELILNEILIRNDALDNPFGNTIRALKYDKKLTIGYLGGSITYGVSAARNGGTIRDSYANKTTDWIKEQFPEAEIEYVNAGISDTATNFGVHRLEKTLMNENGHDMPDLVFIEYTSNDWEIGGIAVGQSKTDLLRQIESLVLNIYSHNPYADIVFVFSARKETSATRPEYIKVAEKYNIPYIDMGIPMQKLMTERGYSQESSGNYYYTVDNLHPSYIGYQVYFDEIKKSLEKYLINSTVYYPEKKNKENELPTPMSTYLWTNPQILDAIDFDYSGADITVGEDVQASMFGTSQDTQTKHSITNGSLVIKGEDNEINFKFTGTTLALIFYMNSSGFNMEITVDGNTKNVSTDSVFVNSKYSHPQLFVFNQTLSLKEHTVKIKFKPTNSASVNVRLGGAAIAGTTN